MFVGFLVGKGNGLRIKNHQEKLEMLLSRFNSDTSVAVFDSNIWA